MRTKEEILKNLFATLHELQNSEPSESLKISLETKLQVLADVLGDDLPEEYYDQLEKFIIL